MHTFYGEKDRCRPALSVFRRREVNGVFRIVFDREKFGFFPRAARNVGTASEIIFEKFKQGALDRPRAGPKSRTRATRGHEIRTVNTHYYIDNTPPARNPVAGNR